ncbi:AraC family transcriptional regulator [Streptomyces glaucosporus]|uniref:AraC family transcriptional regulator n=1 Tax=Streptomyces glaucosporus TaxID=284044 RepID=A0ABP5VRD7_9ACTN
MAGISEVFHAHITGHAYPMHTHATWALLIVDRGMVRYDLHRHRRGALKQVVTLLPPHVPHNGCQVTPEGFRKRVLYLDSSLLDDGLAGLAVDRPSIDDPVLRHRIHLLHLSLARPGDELEAESRLALVTERLRRHLERRFEPGSTVEDPCLAERLRDLLDARFTEGVSLREASGVLHAHPAHLVRTFGRRFGMSPHQYLIGRRVDLARGMLLDGVPPRAVAASTGFYDQSHFTRHFTKVIGTSPGRYARSGPPAEPAGTPVRETRKRPGRRSPAGALPRAGGDSSPARAVGRVGLEPTTNGLKVRT